MDVTLTAVVSLDGKLTKHGSPNVSSWASQEDQQFFRTLLSQHDVIVIGSGTYQAIKDSLVLEPERLRIVLTSRPADFVTEQIEGQLEFHNETPKQLVKRLYASGRRRLLLAGGPQMMHDFLASGLVSLVHLTVEPRLFGSGKPFLAGLPLDIQLQLMEYKQLNEQGTLLLTYKVENP